MAKRQKSKRRVKKGPPPRKPVQPVKKLTWQRLIIYALGIVIILSMTVGLLLAGVGGGGGTP